jgi:hypothetical protein
MTMKNLIRRLTNLLIEADARIVIETDFSGYGEPTMKIVKRETPTTNSVVDELEVINVETLEKAYEELT